MTVKDVKYRVAEVAALVGDPQGAHYEEDRLYKDVLIAISEGTCDDPRACASAALKARGLGFPRWYA